MKKAKLDNFIYLGWSGRGYLNEKRYQIADSLHRGRFQEILLHLKMVVTRMWRSIQHDCTQYEQCVSSSSSSSPNHHNLIIIFIIILLIIIITIGRCSVTTRNADTAWEKLRKKLRLRSFPFSIFAHGDDDESLMRMMMLRRTGMRMIEDVQIKMCISMMMMRILVMMMRTMIRIFKQNTCPGQTELRGGYSKETKFTNALRQAPDI